MNSIERLLLLSLMAGAAIPVGGALGTLSWVWPRWLGSGLRHGIMAFGGGALLSAVALVLVPEGAAEVSTATAAICFGTGGVGFSLLDRRLTRTGGSVAQFVAMLSDFVPEAIALGAAVAKGSTAASLLAGLIALQNLPEGFNAQRELGERSPSARTRPWLFLPLVLVGPMAAGLGFFFLAERPAVLGGLMLFASGGILYLVFQDIAPAAHLDDRGSPALGAVLGFLLGLVGYLLVPS